MRTYVFLNHAGREVAIKAELQDDAYVLYKLRFHREPFCLKRIED